MRYRVSAAILSSEAKKSKKIKRQRTSRIMSEVLGRLGCIVPCWDGKRGAGGGAEADGTLVVEPRSGTQAKISLQVLYIPRTRYFCIRVYEGDLSRLDPCSAPRSGCTALMTIRVVHQWPRRMPS